MRHAFQADPSFRAEHLEAESWTCRRKRAEISRHSFFHSKKYRRGIVAIDLDSTPETLAVNVVNRTAEIDHAVDRMNTHRSQSATRSFFTIRAPLRGLEQ